MFAVQDADAALAEYEQLRDQLPIALVEVAWPSLEVSYMNAIARTLLGYGDEDLAAGVNGLSLLEEKSGHAILQLASTQMAESVAVGRPYRRMKGQQSFEFTGQRKDGSLFPAEVQGSYMLNGQGFPVGVRLMFRDLTERRLAEAEQQRLELQERQAQKLQSLGELAGGIAHGFNNLLTAALGNLHLLAGEVSDRPEALELIHEVENAAHRGAGLVRGLLQFARTEVSTREVFDLAALVGETAALVGPSLPPGVELEVLPCSCPHTTLGEPQALQQLLVNLLVNARDAMPSGGRIRVTLTTEEIVSPSRWSPPGLPSGRYHMLAVRDDGVGMGPDVLERAFDPFFTTKEAAPGRGLGLSTGLGIACSHGGWLSAESVPGEGSTFRLLLPTLEPGDGIHLAPA